MNRFSIIGLLSVSMLLVACDPFHTLSVYNAATQTKEIEVIGFVKDSVAIRSVAANGKRSKTTLIPASRSQNGIPGFLFSLPAQNEAFVAMGFGTRPVTGMIVIDRSDTVHLSQDIRIKKKHFYQAGGEYELKIGEDALLH